MNTEEPPRRASGPPRPAKPTPVRALDEPSAGRAPEPPPPPETVRFQLAQVGWVAEAVGQAMGDGGVSLLLVRFTREEPGPEPAEEASTSGARGAAVPLEAWVPGTRLTEAPERSLVEGLARAIPWKGAATDAPFFVEEGGRRGR